MLRRGGLANYQHLSFAESSGYVSARARIAQRFAMQRSTVLDSHIHLRLSFLEVLQAHSGLRLRHKTLPVRSGISRRMKIQLHSLRWWLLGVNQLRSDRTTVRDWMPFGCSPRQALETPIQATSCVFVSAYRKILQLCHFTRREVQSQYKIAEQKKIPGQRQYLPLQKDPRSARAMTEYF